MKFSDYSQRSPQQQLADLNAAWDSVKKLRTTSDLQQKEITNLKQALREKKIKLWVMTAVVFGLWEVVKFLITLLLHH